MENATKALLIAAAVLIAILLISFGVYIINSTGDVINSSSDALGDLEVSQFNKKFNSYEGNSKNGTTVKTLLQTVVTHNKAQTDNSRLVAVTVTENGTNTKTIVAAATDATIEGTFATGAKYDVACETDNSGLIKVIRLIKK